MDKQVILNTFATDIFRKQADYDYISARANYRMKLRQQFLWSAQQAIEKYLKAILLFNGESARYDLSNDKKDRKEYGHDLDVLVKEVEKLSFLGFDIEQDDRRFLSYLSQHGGANRYLSFFTYSLPDALPRLDRLVWHIRRYCQYIPDRGIGYREAVPGFREAIIRSINDPQKKKHPFRLTLPAGELENVLQRDAKDPARKALIWANLYYGKKRRIRVSYDAFASSERPPNDRGWAGIDWKSIAEFVKPPKGGWH